MTHLLAVDFDVGHVVFEHGRHVHLRELILAEDDQQTGFTAGTIADDHKLFPYSSHWFCWLFAGVCVCVQIAGRGSDQCLLLAQWWRVVGSHTRLISPIREHTRRAANRCRE